MADLVTAAMVNSFLGAKVDGVASDVTNIDTAVGSVLDATPVTKVTLTAAEDISIGDLISLDSNGDAKKYSSGDLLLGTAGTADTASNPVDVVLVNNRRGVLLEATPTNKNSLRNFNYSSESYDFSTQSTTVGSLFIGSSGTKMYLGKRDFTGGRRIYQYTLATAWDISSASYDSKNFNTDSEVDGELVGIFFKPDGVNMFAQSGNGQVYSYTLSTPWDVTTATYDSISKDISITTVDGRSMTFNSDGSALYTTCNAANEVNYYTLSSPWDVSTISHQYALSVSGETTDPKGVSISEDGHFLFIIDSTSTDRLLRYYMPTAYDLSTAYYTNSAFDLSNEGTDPWGLFVKPGGLEFIVQNSGDLYKYTHTNFVPGDRLSVDKYGLFTTSIVFGSYIGYKLSNSQIVQDSSVDLGIYSIYKSGTATSLSSGADTTLLDLSGVSGKIDKIVLVGGDSQVAFNSITSATTLKYTKDSESEVTLEGTLAQYSNPIGGSDGSNALSQPVQVFTLPTSFSDSITIKARKDNTNRTITATVYYHEYQ